MCDHCHIARPSFQLCSKLQATRSTGVFRPIKRDWKHTVESSRISEIGPDRGHGLDLQMAIRGAVDRYLLTPN